MNLEEIQTWLNSHLLEVSLALIGLILIGGGMFWYKTGGQPATQVEVLSADNDQSSTKQIFVDISGAVNSPGVFQLPSGSRVEDALKLAGGLASSADTKWIEMNLNRAQVLIDGAKLYIPLMNDTSSSQVKTSSENISINSATKSELESLPGIGPVTAEKIISNRSYQTLEELVSKKVLNQKLFESLKNQLVVW
ncbi:MAG: helix-hairpin-helix domain-containing protein [bacterium]|nr:helix-hairpin-helix domain-containing protein [bacterium]